jgi:hypothetical protein
MITYVVICTHHRRLVEAATPHEALNRCGCKQCHSIDLKTGRWTTRDVRVYIATADDLTTPTSPLQKRQPEPAPQQLDWVGRL